MFQSVLREHIEVIASLESLEMEIGEAAKMMVACLQCRGKILIMGNGGSAADAQHIAAELVVRYQKDRVALPAIALTTDSSILTATGNDLSFEQLFSRQVEALAQTGDLVIGISTSGNSRNVVLALQAAKDRGAETIGLTGESGGEVGKIADRAISVQSKTTARIQEAHILIGHYWCQYIEEQW